ncbi:UNVERIFIED_CONTAM: 2-dehydropantoate 2-reductase [Brevibacillus sp. OAP136]
MKTLILGAGAMASLFGAKLTQAGSDVTLFNHRANEHTRMINEKGLQLIEREQKPVTINLPVITDPAELAGGYDLVICLVKSFATENVLKKIIPILTPTTIVLTLQNGIGNAEVLETFVPKEQVLVGGTVSGAGIIEPGLIARRGWGKTFIGSAIAGTNEQKLQAIASLFTRSELACEVVSDVMAVIWSKLLVNVTYNGLTAVTRLTNGDAVRTGHGQAIARQLIEEAVQVANAQGIQLLYDNPVEELIRLGIEEIAANKSSMLTDVLFHRRTEIESINGAIVQLGKRFSIATPYNEMMTQLVKVIEESYPQSVTHI